MVKKTFNPQLPFRTSALMIVIACLVVATVEIQALRAKEPAANPARGMNAAECVRCHSDQKSIQIMRMKEDGANYLFNPDGTFKDPKLAALNPIHRHIHDKDKALK